MNILVSGISRGVGLAIARSLLKAGDTVYGIARTESESVSLLKSEFPENLHFRSVDLVVPDEVHQAVFSEFIDPDTPLHGFVNNAAMAYDDLITNLNLQSLEEMYRVNVYSPMILTKYAVRNMLLHKLSGSIVHLSSISVHTGYKGLAMYASTKGGIRSNCIVAGFMETEMSSSLSVEQKARIYNRTSLKKATSIESVAETVNFLLSDRASSVTGQNVHVDSGTI